MTPRTGRPKSENAKSVDIKVRVDEDTNEKLLKYAEKFSTTRSEIIRKGIDLVLGIKK